jgi:pyrroline-5-carboxylate reductase
MATALARGLIAAGAAVRDDLYASDPDRQALERLAASCGLRPCAQNREVAATADVIVLAVKPQSMPEVLAELAPCVDGRHLVVSVAAGVTLAAIRGALGAGPRLVRVMPNTPALVGAAASAYALDASATEADERLVRHGLESIGRVVRVPESLLDAVTGLSGSGPAFVFLVIDALADGGVRVGLPRSTALELAAQTVLGAARMVLETGEHPAVLKDRVASPAGTTIAGLHALERGGVRAAVIDAVVAAAQRAAELGHPPARGS